jgi:hypothetical protein
MACMQHRRVVTQLRMHEPQNRHSETTTSYSIDIAAYRSAENNAKDNKQPAPRMVQWLNPQAPAYWCTGVLFGTLVSVSRALVTISRQIGKKNGMDEIVDGLRMSVECYYGHRSEANIIGTERQIGRHKVLMKYP